RHVIDSNYLRAETLLQEHIEILHNMAHALLDWETLDKQQIDLLMQGRKIAPPIPPAADSAPDGLAAAEEAGNALPDNGAAAAG
ncbi:MAG: cell division protein FtsH, partial [Methylomonas sp.]